MRRKMIVELRYFKESVMLASGSCLFSPQELAQVKV